MGSTTAGPDRTWAISATLSSDVEDYYLYFRAETGDGASEPPFGFWEPLYLRVDPAFEQADWDMDNFVVETGGQETRPGGLGGTVGTTPEEPFTIQIRQTIRPEIIEDPDLRANHDLQLVVDEGDGPYTVALPVSEFRPVSALNRQAPASHTEYDMIYVHHGLGPGSRIEVWCRPIYYPPDHDEPPLVGLVWTLCNEILIDPAGYVYDINTAGFTYEWPAVPPADSLVTNATVTATVRSGDDVWTRWEAEATGQVNPQVTDYTTDDGIRVPGYYAFYVPSGQYRVLATAPGCTSYTSPILTVVDAPVFHNVGLRCTEEAQVGVSYSVMLPAACPGTDALTVAGCAGYVRRR